MQLCTPPAWELPMNTCTDECMANACSSKMFGTCDCGLKVCIGACEAVHAKRLSLHVHLQGNACQVRTSL